MGDDKIETPDHLKGKAFETKLMKKAKKLEDLLIEATMKDYDSLNAAIRHEWELKHPDAVAYTPETPTEAERAEFHQKVNNEYYNWVVPAFETYLEPDPDAANAEIAALRAIRGYFRASGDGGELSFENEQTANLSSAKDEMSHWEGSLQESFNGNFLAKLETVSSNHAALADVARIQLEGNKLQYIRHRERVWDLADKSIKAVEALIADSGKGDGSGWTWTTLVGISLGTMATLGSGGVAAGGAALIVASTLGQGYKPDTVGEPVELGGGTAQEVAVNISEAMGAEDSKLEESEQNVKTAFNNLLEVILTQPHYMSKDESGTLTIAEPALASASNEEIGSSLVPHE